MNINLLMGIPYYFSYILKNHKHILSDIRNIKRGILYLDANSIIYDNLNTPHIYHSIYENINNIIALFNPKKTYIAFDGVAPLAKMHQQRERRYKSYITKNILNKPQIFNTNSITPGTIFMNELNEYLYDKFNDENIIVSGSDNEGEGEFKIFNFMRKEDKNENHIIYGLDADLIMLSLLNYPYNIFLYRETKHFLYFKYIKEDVNYVLNTKLLAEQISYLLYNNKNNIKNSVRQYCFLCFLCGNDFLPHSPSINIRGGDLDYIIEIFKTKIKSNLVNGKNINSDNVIKLFEELSLSEIDRMKRHIIWKRNRKYTDITYEDSLNSLPLKDMEIENILYENPDEYNKLLFNMNDDDDICINYIEMLQWTWNYYNGDIIDNTKYFKMNYTPKFSSLKKWSSVFKKKMNRRYIKINPLSQLTYVLPYDDYSLIPYKNIDNLVDTMEELKETNFKIDYSFCRFFWESHVIFNEIDLISINEHINRYK